jgi:YVTN family beta-propeller protein
MWRRVVPVVAVVLLGGCGGSSAGDGSGATPSTATGTAPAYVVASIDVGTQPCAVEGGFGSVWVSVYGDDVELRIDPDSHKVLARIQTGYSPCGVAVGGGSVWVENYSGDSVTRIDPATNKATEIQVGDAPYDVTFAAGAAWVTNFADGTVSRIDARTSHVRTVKVGVQPVGVAPAGGFVWVTNQADGTISRIDPKTLHVRTTKLGTAPAWTAWGDGRLWVSDTNRVEEVDLDSGRAVRRVRLSGQPNDGDVVNGAVWVTDQDGRLHAIDAATGRTRGTWPLGLANPFVLAEWHGLLWVVDFKGTGLLAIDPVALSQP